MIVEHQAFDLHGKTLIERLVATPPLRLSRTFQNEACFIYFSGGGITVHSAAEKKQVGPGESLLLKCGNYLSELPGKPGTEHYEIFVFHLYPEILRIIYKDEIPQFIKQSGVKSFIHETGQSGILSGFINGLYFYFQQPGLVNNELLELKIKELVLLLMQTTSAGSVASLFSDLFTPRHLGIKEVVSNHIFSDLSVRDLASFSNMSLSTFKRTFHTLYHDSPSNYIRVKRIDRAKELLIVSELTISEIAFQTGFADTAHFSKIFKAICHCTPSDFRVSNR
ncbi:MAG: helix-turn-helix transcriptional regulator [Bacteroidetes bacterium]|nr:helix-turn-helix transcriptional regulator [Bacteroidota bacterium]